MYICTYVYTYLYTVASLPQGPFTSSSLRPLGSGPGCRGCPICACGVQSRDGTTGTEEASFMPKNRTSGVAKLVGAGTTGRHGTTATSVGRIGGRSPNNMPSGARAPGMAEGPSKRELGRTRTLEPNQGRIQCTRWNEKRPSKEKRSSPNRNWKLFRNTWGSFGRCRVWRDWHQPSRAPWTP